MSRSRASSTTAIVWGRGALDMKGGVAMMLAAFMRIKAGDVPPPGDVILCVLADEEAGSDLGASFLVARAPRAVRGRALRDRRVRRLHDAGRRAARFYPVMVAEKQVCWTRATIRGRAGHGSMPIRGGAMGKLGRLLAALDKRTAARTRDAGRARDGRGDRGRAARRRRRCRYGACSRRGSPTALLDVMGERAQTFDPLLHNTASATILAGGEKINVIPDEISLELDCRLLPGFSPQDIFAELRALAGVEVDFELVRHDPVAAEPDMALFDTLAGALARARPDGQGRPAAAAGRHRRALLLAAGHPDLRLPADAAAAGDALHGADPRRGRAAAGRLDGVRHAGDRRRVLERFI